VENCVREGFSQGGFNLKLFARSAFHPARHFHYAFHDWTNGIGIGVERNLNTNHKIVANNSLSVGRPELRVIPGRHRLLL